MIMITKLTIIAYAEGRNSARWEGSGSAAGSGDRGKGLGAVAH